MRGMSYLAALAESSPGNRGHVVKQEEQQEGNRLERFWSVSGPRPE
jgi:hypothetical protein